MWKLSLIKPIVIHQVVSGLVTSQYKYAVRTYLYPNRLKNISAQLNFVSHDTKKQTIWQAPQTRDLSIT